MRRKISLITEPIQKHVKVIRSNWTKKNILGCKISIEHLFQKRKEKDAY